MKNTIKLLNVLLCSALTAGCLVDPDLKLDYSGFEPPEVADGWELSTPEAEGLDPDRIDKVYQKLFSEDAFPTVRSLLVVRHGKLVAEGYSRDSRDLDRLHNLQSATKSITSMLVGAALGEGALTTVDEPLFQLMPDYFDSDVRKRAITIRDVLTMKTGLEFDDDVDTAPLIYSGGSSVQQVLWRRLVAEPGSRFYYHSGNPQLLAGLVREVAGATLAQYAQDHLFGPLGITRYQWEHHADGLSFGGFGLWLRPRDMARIGLLMLRGGAWEGRQLVPRSWIQESTRVHANGNYGYYWWIMEGERRYRAGGDGGQIIYVDEVNDLVIVVTGDPACKDWIMSPGIITTLFSGIYDAIVGP